METTKTANDWGKEQLTTYKIDKDNEPRYHTNLDANIEKHPTPPNQTNTKKQAEILTERVIQIITQSANFAKIKTTKRNHLSHRTRPSQQTTNLLRRLMRLDKQNNSQTKQYKDILQEVHNSTEKDHVRQNIEKWTTINKLNISKNHADYWKEVNNTKTSIEKQFPNQIINRKGKTIKNKREILKETIETLQQITEQKDKEAKKFKETHKLCPSKINNNKRRLNEITKTFMKRKPSTKSRITKKEVEQAIKEFKNNKAPGDDHITYELYKFGNDKLFHELTTLYNYYFENKTVPTNIQNIKLKLAHKKGPRNIPTNYRPLSMMTTILKIYEKILDKRLRKETMHTISELQGGSQREIGCVDTHLILQELIHQNKRKQTILCSYDLSKAYDRVNRDLLWKKLKQIGVDEQLLQAIISTYRCSRTTLQIGKHKSKPTQFLQGIKQGSVLSPILFILYTNELIQELITQNNGIELKTGTTSRKIPCLMYVDDLLLISNSTKELKQQIEILNKFLIKHFAIANPEKTEILARHNTTQLKKYLRAHKLTFNNSIKYLGLTITITNKWKEHIENKLDKVRRNFFELYNRGLQWKQLDPLTILNLIKKLITPTIEYGMEIITLTEKNKTHINKKTAHYIRKALNLDTYTPTKWVLWETDQEDIESISTKRKLNYWHRTMEKQTNTLQKQIMNYKKSLFYQQIKGHLNACVPNKEQLPKKPTWKKIVNTNTKEWQETDILLTELETHQINYTDIKPNKGITKHIFEIQQHDKSNYELTKNIIQLRAQTIKIPGDIKPRTTKRSCDRCTKQSSIYHEILECKYTEHERQAYNEAINHLTNNKIDPANIENKKELMTKILSLTITKDEHINLQILRLTALYYEQYIKR